jgi:hypothetical protein
MLGLGLVRAAGQVIAAVFAPLWAAFATGGDNPKTWADMATGGSFEKTWNDLT